MSELAKIVLDGAGVDMVEALLAGFVSPQDVVIRNLEPPNGSAPGGSAQAIIQCLDAENTPICEMDIVRDESAQDPAWVIKTVAELKTIAKQHGVLADNRYRVSPQSVAGLFSQGRTAVMVTGLPTYDDLDAMRSDLAMVESAPVWCVLSSRAHSALDAGADPVTAAGVARVFAEMIDQHEVAGDLIVIPNVFAPGDPAYPQFDFVNVQFDAAALLSGLGAPKVVNLSATLADRLDQIAPRAVLDEYRRSAYADPSQGAVVLFSGLSGSGKSTVAKAFAARVVTEGVMKTVLVDGDEARQMLSAGLGFDRVSRDLNVERLGYVAAMASSVGALAVLAPIAPFAQARSRVRQRAETVGQFILVHISTPLDVCEQRDRKGLYAKARAGQIPEFTGISSPYEDPTDADVVIDTSEISVDEAVDRVWDFAAQRLGWT